MSFKEPTIISESSSTGSAGSNIPMLACKLRVRTAWLGFGTSQLSRCPRQQPAAVYLARGAKSIKAVEVRHASWVGMLNSLLCMPLCMPQGSLDQYKRLEQRTRSPGMSVRNTRTSAIQVRSQGFRQMQQWREAGCAVAHLRLDLNPSGEPERRTWRLKTAVHTCRRWNGPGTRYDKSSQWKFIQTISASSRRLEHE